MNRTALSSLDGWLLRQAMAVTGRPPICFVSPAGVEVGPIGEAPIAHVRLHTRQALLRMVLDPDSGFGNAFATGEITVDGDLAEALCATYRCWNRRTRSGLLSAPVSLVLALLQRHDGRSAALNASHHYDLSETFFRRWLDRQLVYTCAYYPVPDLTLEQAQIAKMDHICRKLNLLPGERVVEAGCGWGAMALFMARHYGVRVLACNVSREQVRYAQWRAHEEGLDGRVEFVEDDYRNLSGAYDAFVSVGMLEHVGSECYPELGKVIQRTIGNTGRGLLHYIGRSHRQPLSTWIRERIFPGAYAPTIAESVSLLEEGDYEVLDIENLRLHYERTLREWLERFDAAWEDLRQEAPEEFLRAWRLYLAGSIAGFRAGALHLFQVTFAGREFGRIPWTREHLYTRRESREVFPDRSTDSWITAMS